MHAVIRKYTSCPNVVTEARPKMQHLEQTMRGTPGFVAYYFLETEDGVATITITEDETGATESMGRAANQLGATKSGFPRLARSPRGHHRPGPDQRHALVCPSPSAGVPHAPPAGAENPVAR